MKKVARVVTGTERKLIMLRIWFRIILLAWQNSNSFIKTLAALRKISAEKDMYLKANPINKLMRVDGRYFWDIYHAGYPGKSFDHMIRWMLKNNQDLTLNSTPSLRFVMLAITKKCPLNCKHCYEWDVINDPETLRLEDLVAIVEKYQVLGVSQFLLGGGEPLSRYKDLVRLLFSTKETSDFWLSTSGYALSCTKALELKKAGLTGVIISLDHYNESKHNEFRGHNKSFKLAIEAIENAHSAGLVVALSLCTTKDFISEKNLYDYLEYAKSLHVMFIQLIEPREAGRYKNKDVMLESTDYKILDEFFIKVNNNPFYSSYPRIIHPSYDQRKFGCAGAGSRFIMIDTDGRINACPFCRKEGANALEKNTEDALLAIQNEGCYKFEDRVKQIN